MWSSYAVSRPRRRGLRNVSTPMSCWCRRPAIGRLHSIHSLRSPSWILKPWRGRWRRSLLGHTMIAVTIWIGWKAWGLQEEEEKKMTCLYSPVKTHHNSSIGLIPQGHCQDLHAGIRSMHSHLIWQLLLATAATRMDLQVIITLDGFPIVLILTEQFYFEWCKSPFTFLTIKIPQGR